MAIAVAIQVSHHSCSRLMLHLHRYQLLQLLLLLQLLVQLICRLAVGHLWEGQSMNADRAVKVIQKQKLFLLCFGVVCLTILPASQGYTSRASLNAFLTYLTREPEAFTSDCGCSSPSSAFRAAVIAASSSSFFLFFSICEMNERRLLKMIDRFLFF